MKDREEKVPEHLVDIRPTTLVTSSGLPLSEELIRWPVGVKSLQGNNSGAKQPSPTIPPEFFDAIGNIVNSKESRLSTSDKKTLRTLATLNKESFIKISPLVKSLPKSSSNHKKRLALLDAKIRSFKNQKEKNKNSGNRFVYVCMHIRRFFDQI